MDMRFFIAAPMFPSGFSYTLASRLGQMLHIAESWFGPRDKSYTPLGVEFAGNVPQIWYPGNSRNVVIQLSLSCLNDMPTACYQLAHECIHLLSPLGTKRSNVLEEGIATRFSRDYVLTHFPEALQYQAYQPPSNYAEAMNLAGELLSLSPNLVKHIRLTEPTISDITSELILAHCPDVPEGLALALAAPFRYGDTEI